jgi:hypothetical protein
MADLAELRRYYFVMSDALNTRGGVSPREYHNLAELIRQILGEIFINPVPEAVLREVTEIVSTEIADHFMRFLDNVQTGNRFSSDDDRDALLEWLNEDIQACIAQNDAPRYRALWVCWQFLRTYRATSEEEMYGVNATVARVYVDALTGRLSDSSDTVDSMWMTLVNP